MIWYILASEVVSLFLIWRIWRSCEHVFFKLAISVIALIPFAGPLLAYWIIDWPQPMRMPFRNQQRHSPDVHDRWRHVFEEDDPLKRQKKYRDLVIPDRDAT